MKNLTPFLFLLITFSFFAQSPEKMSYQAVIRDATNTLLTNQSVGMQISILQTTTTGTAVYIETQTVTTNTNGLVSLEIGMGDTSDDFSAIDWKAGPYFVKTETDPTGGSSYTITGTSQLMSVPFALYAKSSGSSETNATNIANNTTSIELNTLKVGITAQQASDITSNNAKTGITTEQSDAIVANTAKTGITSDQATAITDNTAKTGITSGQASEIAANTAKVGYTEAAVTANTAVAANTLKVGITAQQASDITSNNAKTGITSDQATAITDNTAKIGITSAQASAITANTAKTVMTLGTTSTTALAGNTVTITPEQVSAIAANASNVSWQDDGMGNITNTNSGNTNIGDGVSGINVNSMWDRIDLNGYDIDLDGVNINIGDGGMGGVHVDYGETNIGDGMRGINVNSMGDRIDLNGDVTVFGYFSQASDKRFKKDIVTINNALSKVLQLRGVNYYWKNNDFPNRGFDDKLELGFIAQEVEVVIPEIVSEIGDGYKGVEYSKLVALLVEAIKEQQAIIDGQKTEMADMRVELDGRLKALEEMFNTTTTTTTTLKK